LLVALTALTRYPDHQRYLQVQERDAFDENRHPLDC
jgi:hypothetical protein